MVRFPLLFLSLLASFAFPQGAEAQGVFEIMPDTLFTDESGHGQVVMYNATSNTVVLDSISMRWPDPAVEEWIVTASGAPTGGEEVDYWFSPVHDTTHTRTANLSFAPEDTLHLSIGIFDICPVCVSTSGPPTEVDTLLFHSNGLFANDTLIIDWSGTISDEEAPTHRSGIALSVSPNPSAGLVEVNAKLEKFSEVSIIVFDIRGKRIAELVRGAIPAGEHVFRWDGAESAPGVYVFLARSDEAIVSQIVTISR